MYDWPEFREQTDRYWKAIRQALAERGLAAPVHLMRDGDARDQWNDPDLLVSQTCGYPYAKDLRGRVRPILAPTYNVTGCGPGTYSSAVVVRADHPAQSVDDLQSATLACNGLDSLSGKICLDRAKGSGFAAQVVISGSHRASASMVAEGEANFACLDAVSWTMFQQCEPAAAKSLRVVGWLDRYPSLPYIVAGDMDDRRATAIRESVLEAIGECHGATNAPCIPVSAETADDATYAWLHDMAD